MIGQRISAVRGDLSRAKFAEILGVHANTLQRYESGERNPDSDFLEKLIRECGLSPKWVMLGEGDMYDDQNSGNKKAYEACDVDLIYVPRVRAQLSAGNGSLVTDQEVEGQYAFRSDWISKKGQPKQMVILGVDGVSMQPEINDNDIVMIDTSQTEVRSGKIYAVGVEGTILVKYVDIEPGQLVLRSRNSVYRPICIPIEDEKRIKIIGRVVWISREY